MFPAPFLGTEHNFVLGTLPASPGLPVSGVQYLGYLSSLVSHKTYSSLLPANHLLLCAPLHEKNSISKIYALAGLLGTGLPSPRDVCQATSGTEVGATKPSFPLDVRYQGLCWSEASKKELCHDFPLARCPPGGQACLLNASGLARWP